MHNWHQFDFQTLVDSARADRLEREEKYRRIDAFHAERNRLEAREKYRCEHGILSLCPECSYLR